MSLITLAPQDPVTVPNPDTGKVTLFVSSQTQGLVKKSQDGSVEEIGGTTQSSSTTAAYTALHTTSGSRSIYTLDLTGRATPKVGEPILIKLGSANVFGDISVTIAGLGSYNLFKAAGISFSPGELASGQLISIVIDGSSSFYLSGFLQQGVTQVQDVAALKALMAASSLQPGSRYSFTYQAKYVINGTQVDSGVDEVMQVVALAPNRVSGSIFSTKYPSDVIEMDFNHPTLGYKIVKREDPIKGLVASYDWRQVKFRRGRDASLDLYIIEDINASEFTADFKDILTFDDAEDGGTCRNVSIGNTRPNLSNTSLSPYAPWNLEDGSNVFFGCRDIKLLGSCYLNNFYNQPDSSPSNNPGTYNGIVANNLHRSTLGNVTFSVLQDCSLLHMRGTLGSGEYGLVNSVRVSNSKSIEILGNNTGIAVESSENVAIEGCNRVHVISSRDIKAKGSDHLSIESSRDLLLISAADSIINSCKNCSTANSGGNTLSSNSGLFIESCQDSVLGGISGCYEVPKGKAVIADTTVNPTSIIIRATLSNPAFVDGDVLEVDNAFGMTIDRPTSIGFDTDSNGSIDTAVRPIDLISASVYPAIGAKFFLLYLQNEFYLMPHPTNNPIKVQGQKRHFSPSSSNLDRTALFQGGTLYLSDTGNYNFTCAGTLSIDHPGTDVITNILPPNPGYPGMTRRLRNGNATASVTLRHGVGLICPGGTDVILNGPDDYADLVFENNKWKVLGSGTY